MLPTKKRLPRSRIEFLFKKGKRISSNALSAQFLSTKNPSSRFCIAVSTHVAPKAVNRNHLRRQISEILRRSDIPLRTSFDIVLVAKPKLIELPYKKLAQNIEEIFKKINTLP